MLGRYWDRRQSADLGSRVGRATASVTSGARRESIATRVIAACRERCRGCPAGRKFVPSPRAEDGFNEQFIHRQLTAGVIREELDQLARMAS